MRERAAETISTVARSGAPRSWLADLAAGLDRATRLTVRLRPDGLLEVIAAGAVLGYVDYVAPVFVALSGEYPCFAVEVAQRHTLAAAVDALRMAAQEAVA
jgi:hypothetical protein